MNESLDSRQLHAFVVLARTGSHTETAKQLFVTHSAISHSIRELEGQVGCRLFGKLGKKSILTEAGEALLHHALRILNEMSRARNTLTELNEWGSRRLRLAVDPIFMPAFLGPVLAQFHREFPRVRLLATAIATNEPSALLEMNGADVVLAEKPLSLASAEFTPLLADRFLFVVSPHHPLASQKKVQRRDLEGKVFLMLRASHAGRSQMEDFFRKHEINLNVAMEIENLDAIKELLKDAQAISFLPNWTVAADLKNRKLAAVFPGSGTFEKTWGLLHSRERPLNHVEASWLKLCRRRVAEIG